MKRKVLVYALAFTIVGAGIAGAALNTSAFAAKVDRNEVEVSDQQEQVQLEKEAKITKEESTAIARKEVPGEVKEIELDDEDGTVVYEVDIVDAKGIEHEVQVDAKTGKVLKVEADKEDDMDEESSDEAEQTQLATIAKISKEESVAIALKEVKGTVGDVELDDEDGTIVYEVEIVGAKGIEQEVKVDAKSGKIVKVENDENDAE